MKMTHVKKDVISVCFFCAFILLGVFCTRCLFLLRALYLCRTKASRPFHDSLSSLLRTRTANYLIFLGSGGHTREMLSLLSLWQSISPQGASFDFCVGDSDRQSNKLLASFAQEHSALDISLPPSKIKRNREVGGSFLRAIFNTLGSLFSTIKLILALRPDLVTWIKHSSIHPSILPTLTAQ
eukprot:TRINITY_DN2369_c0_g1_i1.p1 TRINITY_DN2369_c0_g1~~TRINITY_DN2369_c0_g1_i1.p1  ORF type:complete len:182 (+),score=26.87 TRINITY_DN2369_c0_g1_i1:45-590(+)